jgi:hypothetical protein
MLTAKTFEKVRRYALWTAIGSAAAYLLFQLLQSWGAFETAGGGDEFGYGGDPTFWGKLIESLSIIFGISVAVVIVILFVIPRNKD